MRGIAVTQHVRAQMPVAVLSLCPSIEAQLDLALAYARAQAGREQSRFSA